MVEQFDDTAHSLWWKARVKNFRHFVGPFSVVTHPFPSDQPRFEFARTQFTRPPATWEQP